MLYRSRTKGIPVRRRFGYFFSGAGAGTAFVLVVAAGFEAGFGGNGGALGAGGLLPEPLSDVGSSDGAFVPPASALGSSFFSARRSFRSLNNGSMVHLETM